MYTLGNLMRHFSTYQAAHTYLSVYDNYNWTIKALKCQNMKPTNKQIATVHFYERWLNIFFKGY